jgi:hypothetical protein
LFQSLDRPTLERSIGTAFGGLWIWCELWSKVLREKLIAIQEFKKFPVIYGPEMFISNVTTQSKIKQILNLLVVMEYNLLWRLSGSIFKALTA